MNLLLRQIGIVLTCTMLAVPGCATWQSQFLRAMPLCPASPTREQLVGVYSIFAPEDGLNYEEDDGGVKLLSDGSYYEEFISPETGQVFINDSGRWQYQTGHLHLESDHRVIGKTFSHTKPDYVVASTSRRAGALLRLLPTSVGSFQGERLYLQGQPTRANLLPDKVGEGSGILSRSKGQLHNEASEKKQLEGHLRANNYWAGWSAHATGH